MGTNSKVKSYGKHSSKVSGICKYNLKYSTKSHKASVRMLKNLKDR